MKKNLTKRERRKLSREAMDRRTKRNLRLKGTRHLPDPDVVARCYACGGPIFNESKDDVGVTTMRHRGTCPRPTTRA